MINVSVIIPIYNQEDNIKECALALLNQTYPRDQYELLFIDNGSTDKTSEILASLDIPITKYTDKKNSYAARNYGLSIAKGKVIAFIDGDCIACPGWIEEGLKALNSLGSNLIGGKIIFSYNSPICTSQLLDSIIHLQNFDNVKYRNASVTANLFAEKEIFSKIGNFPEGTKSGADIRFTAYAASKGYKISYSERALIHHESRRWNELLNKIIRTSKGKVSSTDQINMIGNKFNKRLVFFPYKKSIHLIKSLALPKYWIFKMVIVFYFLKVISFYYYCRESINNNE